jgi:hypothetical protein
MTADSSEIFRLAWRLQAFAEMVNVLLLLSFMGNMSASSTPRPQKLLDQVRSAIRLRHYSPRTEEAYVGWIRRFVIFQQKRHPAEMGDIEVRQFLTHLAEKLEVSAATQNQALNALGASRNNIDKTLSVSGGNA